MLCPGLFQSFMSRIFIPIIFSNTKIWFKVTKDEWSMTNNSKKQLNYTIRNDYIFVMWGGWWFHPNSAFGRIETIWKTHPELEFWTTVIIFMWGSRHKDLSLASVQVSLWHRSNQNSAKHIENLKEFSIPSFQSSASVTPEVPRTKLSSLIKSKSQKSSVNRLSTFSAIKWIIWPCLTPVDLWPAVIGVYVLPCLEWFIN